MRKKLLAVLLASTMIMQPLSAVGATEFEDGIQSEEVFEFEDEESLDAGQEFEAEPEAETTGAEVKTGKPSEDAIQMGDDVWFTYDASTSTGTISGTGAMWDYLQDGRTLDNQHENPFKNQINTNIDILVIEGGVTHVGDYLLCEMGHGIKKIILKTGIQSIGKYTFYNIWSLQDVVMEEGIQEIGEYGFYNCWGLKEIIFPNSLEKIGNGCFAACGQLETVKLSTLLSEIPNNCFGDCESLTNFDIPNNITRIGDYAFRDCSGLETIDLSEGLSEIGNLAFDGCSRLNNVIIPGTVKTLYHRTFSNCLSLSNITLQEGLERIRESAFEGCIRLQEITIPQSVVNIAYDSNDWNAFYGCDNLTKIKGYTCSGAKKYYDSLSDELKKKITFESIGEGTHKWNSDKTVIKEPSCTENGLKAQQCNICGAINEDSKEEIAAYGHDWNGGVITKEPTETEDGVRTYTCWRCNGTKNEPIPKLSAIQINDVYYEWNEYNTVCINFSVNKDGSYYTTWVPKDNDAPQYDSEKVKGTFKVNCSKEIEVKDLPDDEVDIYIFVKDADGNNTYAKVTLDYRYRPEKPSNKFQAGDNVFATVDGNKMIISGSGETWSKMFGWYGGNKSQITEVNIEGNITNIGDWFFYGFNSLNKIELSSSIKTIGDMAFFECSSLEKIQIPSSVESIGTETFWQCSNLKEIQLPDSLKSIGGMAFYNEPIN